MYAPMVVNASPAASRNFLDRCAGTKQMNVSAATRVAAHQCGHVSLTCPRGYFCTALQCQSLYITHSKLHQGVIQNRSVGHVKGWGNQLEREWGVGEDHAGMAHNKAHNTTQHNTTQHNT